MPEVRYPTLIGEIAKRRLQKTEIAKQLGMDSKTFYNKLNGVTEFSWPEVNSLRDAFFPDMQLDDLMS
jgi:hypothetical protein